MTADEHRIGLLTEQEQARAREWLADYFETERDEPLGVIASQAILDAFLEAIGPVIYNRALSDAKGWMTRRLADMDVDFEALRRTSKELGLP